MVKVQSLSVFRNQITLCNVWFVYLKINQQNKKAIRIDYVPHTAVVPMTDAGIGGGGGRELPVCQN